MFNNQIIAGSSGQGGGGFYSRTLDQSLRFDDGGSHHLTFTPSSAGNQKTWTWSAWIKRANLGVTINIFNPRRGGDGSNESQMFFNSSDQFRIYDSGALRGDKITTRRFRDTSSWYHIVVALDTTDATAADRIKIYVNGERETSFSNNTNPSQNTNWGWNAAHEHSLGSYNFGTDTRFFDGSMAEVHFIDGTALEPTSFGETNNDVWVPKEYSGSYGTNGWYLPFAGDVTSEGFNTVTYTGTASTQSISGLGFKPDLVWIKNRSATQAQNLFDSVRGAGKILYPDRVDAEGTTTIHVNSFDNDGFTIGSATSANGNGNDIVAWCWDAGTGSAASNTYGSITSTVKANADYGFSIVSYTGTGANATVGHGLSSAPEMIIVKGRAASNWSVYHSGTASDAETDYMLLNTTAAAADLNTYWNDTAPTSSVFSLGTDSNVNGNTATFISYCFHSVSGYSKFSSYTGTGSTGNSITGLGFEPAFVMIKRSDSSGGWHVFDNTRHPYNPKDRRIEWDNSDAENSAATVDIDFDSDGFTLQTSFDNMNASGGTYIYMAFADTRDNAFWKDASGNGNNWTPNNLDYRDQSPDSPTNNFGTMNPLDKNSINLAEGNLRPTASADYKAIRGTFGIPTSGKWYFEARVITGGGGNIQDQMIGVVTQENVLTGSSPYPQSFTYGVGYFGSGKINRAGSTAQSSLTALTAGDILGVAVNVDDNEVQFYLNGTAEGTTKQLVSTTEPNFAFYVGTTNRSSQFNFGQDSTFSGGTSSGGNSDANGNGDFKYSPPSGHLALCTASLDELAIGPNSTTVATDHFDTKLWSADVANPAAGDKQISLDFQPDLVWSKNRNNAENHYWMDSVRGDNVGNKWLRANSTAAEGADAVGSTTAKYDFTSTGFDIIDTNSGSGEVYYNSRTYVGWCWKAGGATPTQTYTVKVVSDSGNKYRFDDFGTSAVTLELQEGGTYTFDQSDSSNSGHPLRFSTTSNGTHGGGTEYTTGVTTSGTPGSAGAKTTITVASGAPTLYYYCSVHSGMGGQANTNSTFGSSNFKGSLQNVVSANKEAGFSIVTWTAPNDNGTLGHGLDSAPELIIAKPLGSGTNWYVMHTPGGVVPANNVLNLDNTSAAFNPGVNHFNDTYPTSTVFSYGGYLGDDLSNDDKVAYCYHSVEGYSKVGSYKGNGSTDGTFVYTGFSPAWVMVKCSSSSQGGNADWRINDSLRLGYNPESREIYANLALAEASGNPIDIVSNGFKIRNSSSGYNGSGATYIYLAFAEMPFKYANAR